MTASLADCAKVNGAFDKPVKVVVADRGSVQNYQSRDGEERQSLTVAVTDGSGVMKVIVYDRTKFPRFTVGSSITLRNIICRDQHTLVITKNSRVFLTSQMTVPKEKLDEAKTLLNPPKAPFVSLTEGLASPPKKCISIKGQVVQDDKEREVSVKNTPTKVKEVWLADDKNRVKITLWREQCATKFHTGDFIEVTDVVTSTYKNETSFSLTSRSTIQVVEALCTGRSASIEGISIDGDMVELLTTNDEVLSITKNIVEAAMPTDSSIDTFFCGGYPVELEIVSRGATIESIKLL